MAPRTLAALPSHASTDAWIEFDLGDRRVRWTHRELVDAASRVANALGEARPGAHGDRPAVVVDGPPSGAWLLAALGAMMAGRPVIAFPETIPTGETASALPPLAVDCFVTQDAARWPGRPCLALADVAGLADGDPVPTGSAPTLTFDVVAFTSGTTAAQTVKAFRLGPESTEAFAEEFCRRFGLRAGDVWAVCHSFSHVVHLEYVLACLLRGIDVTVIPAPELVHAMGAVAPSAVITVPAVYEQLARFLENRVRRSPLQRAVWRLASTLPDSALSSGRLRALLTTALPAVGGGTGNRLKVLIIGAAASTPMLKRRLSALGLPLYEGYGMTELGMIACQGVGDVRLGTVGRPWPGQEVWVDEEGVLVVRPKIPRTDGYLGAGAEESPLMDPSGAVVTGDLASQDADGHIRILGRKKAVIVTDRGKNVNPTAVEGRLGRLPQVLAAVAYGDGRPYLSAVVFLEPTAEDVTGQELEDVNTGAPDHERVHALVQSRVVPSTENGLLTRSGKIRTGAVIDMYQKQLAEVYRR